MKRNLSLGLCLLALSMTPVLANAQSKIGNIHGRVLDATGMSPKAGKVGLSTDGGKTDKYSFELTANGEYKGEAEAGSYTLTFRQPEHPELYVDIIPGIKIVAGQDILQDDDMTRKAYIDGLSPEARKQVEEYKAKNAAASKTNAIIAGINKDLGQAQQFLSEGNGAHAAAIKALGEKAEKADIAAKESEIKKEKYGAVIDMMTRDSELKPDASPIWAQLGLAQLGLQKFEEAETTFKKVLELEATAKKPNPGIQGYTYAGLGEIYARTGKVPEATAAYDNAAKANPTQAALYLKNQAIIYDQIHNDDAEAAAADKAIALNPTDPMLYYLKGKSLVAKSGFDQKTNKLLPPPGCVEAYMKYLELAPNGQFVSDVKSILTSFDSKIDNNYKVTKKK